MQLAQKTKNFIPQEANDIMKVLSQYQDHMRIGLAAFAFLAIIMPWAPLGPDKWMHGGQMISHMLTGGETWAWLTSGNFFGALMFITFPIYMIPVILLAFLAAMRRRKSPLLNLIVLIAPPLTMAAASYPMLDSTPSRIMGITMPLWGLQLAMLSHAILLGHNIYQDFSRRWRTVRKQRNQEPRSNEQKYED